MKPGVIFGGPSPEHDVSVLTGLQAARALGSEVEVFYWDKLGAFWAVEPEAEGADFLGGAPKGARPVRLVAGPDGGFVSARGGMLGGKDRPIPVDAVVNCCHGGPGEDGTLQGALDLAGVAYTGPGVAAAALGLDKLAFGAAAHAAGLPSLPRLLLAEDTPAPDFEGPYIVKPRFGGSSIGIEVVGDWDTAKALLRSAPVHYALGAVAEPYRPASFDLEVGLRSYPSVEVSAIARPLRSAAGSEILGYRDKYLGGEGMVSAAREFPAQVAPALEKAVHDAAHRVVDVARVRGVARLDFLVDGEDLFVNEINTIPGSLAKYLWSVPFPTLLADMLAEATARPSCRYDSTYADGLALRSAASIASKLG